MGTGAFPADHSLYVGMIGMHGVAPANKTVAESDLIIAAGARFADRTIGLMEGFAPKAKIIHIDIDPAEIGKNIPVDTPIVGDVKQVLSEIEKHVASKDKGDWNNYVDSLKQNATYSADSKGLNPVEVIRHLSDKTKGKAIITTEVGCHQMWTAQHYKFIEPRSFISSGGLGTMGYGLPAAIGAQFANGEKMVINICGDGSFQMNLQEMATAVENNLPIKIILFNNQGLGLVRQLQEFYCDKRYNQVHFRFAPDFIKLAASYGIEGLRIQKQEEISAAIDKLIEHKGPFLLECVIDINENVYPMVLNGSPINEMIGG